MLKKSAHALQGSHDRAGPLFRAFRWRARAGVPVRPASQINRKFQCSIATRWRLQSGAPGDKDIQGARQPLPLYETMIPYDSE